jgi:hypothetical protein
MLPAVVPQLVANDGTRALRHAIADPDRVACEPKVDGVRGLVVYQSGGILEMRNRKGEGRDWLWGDSFETGLRRLGGRLPNVWDGTVLDGELTAGRFEGTMAALLDVPISWTLMFRDMSRATPSVARPTTTKTIALTRARRRARTGSHGARCRERPWRRGAQVHGRRV